MAVWTPVTVVPTSLATVAIDTFITALSRVIRNWPAARVGRTIPAVLARRVVVLVIRASPDCFDGLGPDFAPDHQRSAEPRSAARRAPCFVGGRDLDRGMVSASEQGSGRPVADGTAARLVDRAARHPQAP